MPITPPPRADGPAIQAMRLHRAMSLRTLADLAGVNPGHLSRIERGQRSGSARLAAVIAQHLDCPVAVITTAA